MDNSLSPFNKTSIISRINRNEKVKKEIVTGQVEVKQTFKISKVGTIALGGLGSGFADNEEELNKLAEKAFSFSPRVRTSRFGWSADHGKGDGRKRRGN